MIKKEVDNELTRNQNVGIENQIHRKIALKKLL